MRMTDEDSFCATCCTCKVMQSYRLTTCRHKFLCSFTALSLGNIWLVYRDDVGKFRAQLLTLQPGN